MIATDPNFLRGAIRSPGSLPSIPSDNLHRAFAAAGGLMSDGATVTEKNRVAGQYTGRILAAEIASDLSILQPSKLDLVVNLSTPKALVLVVPPSILARADEVIE